MLQTTKSKSKGFGKVYKAVFMDTDLPIKSKAIYSYLMSLAGSSTKAFPSIPTLCYQMKMTRGTLYKYLNSLIQSGYIRKENRIKNSNVYYLLPLNTEVTGSYGYIERTVTTDHMLSASAKALYAYLCCFAGNDSTAHPTIGQIIFHLGISVGTYSKLAVELKKCGYIFVTQRSIFGKKDRNDFTLILKEERLKVSSQGEFFSPIQKPTVKKPSTNNQTSNRNRITSPNKINNHSIDREDSPTLSKKDVYTQISKDNCIPYSFAKNRQVMRTALEIVTCYSDITYDNPDEQIIFESIIDQIVQLATSKMNIISGAHISYAKIIDKINDNAKMYYSHRKGMNLISITDLIYSIHQNFYLALSSTKIKNPKAYLKTCIWNSLNDQKLMDAIDNCEAFRDAQLYA